VPFPERQGLVQHFAAVPNVIAASRIEPAVVRELAPKRTRAPPLLSASLHRLSPSVPAPVPPPPRPLGGTGISQDF